MSVMTKEGLNALKFAYLVLAAGIGVAAFLVTGAYLYWQAEKKNNVQSQRAMSDTQTRLANAKRERDDLRNSEDTYNALTARGLFIAERRLDLLDAFEALKVRHHITTLEFDVGTQRPLKLASGTSITAVDPRSSRVRLRARALHDGDLLAFLNEFSRMQRGLFPMDRCVMRREGRTDAAPPPATAATSSSTNQHSDAVAHPTTLSPQVEAECTLEWITLVDRRAPRAGGAAAASPASAKAQ